MPRISFEFELNKVARLVPQAGPPIIVGDVEEYFEHTENGKTTVKTIVKLKDELKPQHLDMLIKNPGMISFTGVSRVTGPAILLPEIEA